MDVLTFSDLALACAPAVHGRTAHALVATESGFNPHAIGVVGGQLDRQPRTRAEALATAQHLQAAGWNFSVGLAQINVGNFERLAGSSIWRRRPGATNKARPGWSMRRRSRC